MVRPPRERSRLRCSVCLLRPWLRRLASRPRCGSLFYFLFHTGFVGAETALHVPLNMMDRACKNSKGLYRSEGESVLTFAASEPGSVSPRLATSV